MPEPLAACPSPRLSGRAEVPGDKSISHRALMLGALAIGETTISGLLEAEDVINTARAMAALGALVERWRDGSWHVHGVGTGGFRSPDNPIDFGNSGTGARLAAGLIATSRCAPASLAMPPCASGRWGASLPRSNAWVPASTAPMVVAFP